MSMPRDRPQAGPMKARRMIFHAPDFDRIASILESARHRVLADSIRTRSAERGVGRPQSLPDAPSTTDPHPPATASFEEATALISSRLDEIRPQPAPREVFDPCRESPWWQLEDRSGC